MKHKDRKLQKKFNELLDKIRYAYWDLVPYDYRPGELWYKLKCSVWHRYTVVKGRYLPLTWMDRTAVLPHTMFEILSNFIEEECSPGHVDWDASGHTVLVDGVEKNVRKEMQDLYDWWHQQYNKEYEEVHDIIWREVEKHPPIREFIPIDRQRNEVNEDDAEMYLWHQEFATEENEEIHNRCMKSLTKLELMQDKKLNEMMHRLVNLTPYLWT